MSNHLCKSKIECDDPNSPVGFFNAESVDGEIFFSRFQMFLPPALDSSWLNSMNTGMCQGTTQDMADACAMEDFMRQACVGKEVPPVFPLPSPPDVFPSDACSLFQNSPQSCIGTCPDGLPFVFTVGTGRFTAFSQAVADAMAHSYACNQILENRVCIGKIPSSESCVMTPYNVLINCTGNFSPLSFSDPKHTLPPGLSLASAGPLTVRISGTPTTIGTFSFRLRATDTHGNFMEKVFMISVLGITTGALPNATNGTAYSYSLAFGGTPSGGAIWGILSGSLPAGLSLNSTTGVISGTPTSSGSGTFTVGLSDDILTCTKQLTLTVSASVTCVIANGSLPVNPTFELAMSSNIGTRRMISTSLGGGAGTIDVINTATGAVVTHIATAFDAGWPAFATVNNTFWVQNVNTDQLKKYDSNGTLLSTITPSPGDVFNAPMSYEPNTAKIYFTVQGANYIIYEINPSTNAVVAGLNLGPPGADAAVFATPGKLFVAAAPPTGDASVFDIYSVPGYAHIGQLPTTSVAANQQAFTYCPTNGKAYLSAVNAISGHCEIWEINPATGSVDFIYDLDPTFIKVASMAFDPVHGRIFAIDLFNGVGVVINPVSRTIVCTIAAPIFGFPYDSLVCDPVTGIFYFADSFGATGINKWA